jgi:hypothetical protein
MKIGDIIARKDMLLLKCRIIGEIPEWDAWEVEDVTKLKGMNTPLDEDEMIAKGYGKTRRKKGDKSMVFKDDDRWIVVG